MIDRKRTIAVTTMRCNTRNYGGALQAYALHKEFEKLGYFSELINFDISKLTENANENKTIGTKRIFRYSPVVLYKKVLKRIILKPHKIYDRFQQRKFQRSRTMRHQAFDNFEKNHIPQTDIVYTKDNFKEVLAHHDFFVCGSDQVWNPKFYNEFYRMDLVPKSFPKFSYAASVSANSLTDEQSDVFRQTLSSYIGVSVREKQTVSLLQNLSPVPPIHSLDPTLLLDRTDWDIIASNRLVKKPYVFCYFLDCGEKLRKLAKEYAKKKHLRVVCIPYVLNCYHTYENKYNDQFIESASPADFISLIKFADVVFTDSFHASVFSTIYKKDFFVFRRHGSPGMSSRIETLTQMFGTDERFCDTDEKETISYIEQCSPIDFSNQEEYLCLKEKSIAYLMEMLKKSEQKVNNEI